MDILARIKRLVIRQQILWTKKAEFQMEADGLDRDDVVEAIVNATSVVTKRSTSRFRRSRAEKVHILIGLTFDGRIVYTKGVIRKTGSLETFYVMISAKNADPRS